MKGSMNDVQIKELCGKAFDDIHASSELTERISEIKNKDIKEITDMNKKISTKKIIKITSAVMAAAALITAGGAIVSASKSYKGEYETILVNGEENSARYAKVNDGIYFVETIIDHTAYSIWIYGDYDVDRDTLNITDNGEYIVVSTEGNEPSSPYEAMENSEYIEIVNENGKEVIYRYPTGKPKSPDEIYLNSDFHRTDFLQLDDKDGSRDGVAVFADYENGHIDYETLNILPNGTSVFATRTQAEGYSEWDELLWGILWGEEDHQTLIDYAAEQDKKSMFYNE